MYVCGPTTYNYIHLGNARPLVVFDIIRRYLQYRGYEVTYVQNFTDVDDKIINRALEKGIPASELACKYVEEYFRDADALGVKRAEFYPRVSEHMPDIIQVIQGLIDKGYAYQVEGDVYYRVNAFNGYGKLSGRSLEEMLAGARVEVDERKEHPMDFALWKKAKPGEPYWDSPWGPGRPGWHIECSVMSMKYLGDTLDIHGGGADLIFPHHENEIAQSEAYTGKPFARYWLHNGFITVNREKMSKSLGNFFILRDILDKYPADTVRFYLAATHYRSPLDFDNTKLEEAGRALGRLKNTLRRMDELLPEQVEPDVLDEAGQAFLDVLDRLRQEFTAAMDDDFNTARAMGCLFDMAREINSYLDSRAGGLNPPARVAINRARQVFTDLGERIMGILELRTETGAGLVDEMLGILVELRGTARQNRDYTTADRIRDFLVASGVNVEDTSRGTRVTYEQVPEVARVIDFLLGWREEARQARDFTTADAIRDKLVAAGVTVKDTREGVRWSIDSAGKLS